MNKLTKIANAYATSVKSEWVDYNGHMRDAFYSLVFSYAVDELMDLIGIDKRYRTLTKGTIYVLEFHMYFLREVKENAPLKVENIIIDSDAKRIHLYQSMYSEGEQVAICESMQLHVVQNTIPKASPMPLQVQEKLSELKINNLDIANIPFRSRAIGLNRKG